MAGTKVEMRVARASLFTARAITLDLIAAGREKEVQEIRDFISTIVPDADADWSTCRRSDHEVIAHPQLPRTTHSATQARTSRQKGTHSEMKWLGSIVASVVTALLVAWVTEFPHRSDWPPERAGLLLGNFLLSEPQPADDSFRVVLCWLEDDRSGDDTRTVAQAFASTKGIAMVRSAGVVSASGAADEWLSEMQANASVVLDDWNADLMVAGRVKKPANVLSLWMVRRSGTGTLGRGDPPCRLEDVTLGLDFHEDLRTQLAAVARSTMAPLANNEARGRLLNEGLGEATEKLATLLDSGTIENASHRVASQVALGDGLHTLGEREILAYRQVRPRPAVSVRDA